MTSDPQNSSPLWRPESSPQSKFLLYQQDENHSFHSNPGFHQLVIACSCKGQVGELVCPTASMMSRWERPEWATGCSEHHEEWHKAWRNTFTALICETIPLLARRDDTWSWALCVAPTHYSSLCMRQLALPEAKHVCFKRCLKFTLFAINF